MLLGFCQDPRGCYLGEGQGCTATGIGALTESHGPLSTSNGIPTATGTGAAKSGATGRWEGIGAGGIWGFGMVSVVCGVAMVVL